MTQFAARSDRIAFALIALDWAIVVAAGLAADRVGGFPAWLVAAVIIAGRQTAMLNLTHSACHRALFVRPRWNEALEVLYALPIADTVARYRGPHLEHHREIATRDPARFAFLHAELGLPARGAWGRTWVVFLRPLLGHAAFTHVRGTLRAVASDRTFRRKMLVFWGLLVGAAAVGGALRPLSLYWILPQLWLHPVFLLWGEVSDHFQAPGDTRDHIGPFHAALANGHGLYHEVHHRYAFIPFYRERKARAHLERLGKASPEISRSFLDFVRRIYGPAPEAA